MKKAFLWVFGIFLVLVSLALVGYPFISNYLNSMNSDSEVVGYLNTSENLSEDEYTQMLAMAKEYNNSLIGNVKVGDPFAVNENKSEEYNSLLSIDGSSVMASIEIPVIDVNLAIYHGTSDEILQKGVGHIAESSLPIGGKGTHAVLTGHTGLSSRKLFSDVDKLTVGDVFFIHILGDTLAYQIDEINVVLPEETDKLQIDPDEDYVTLVTCTPFGVNSHRLLVRGTRISYDEAKELVADITQKESTWNTEYINAIILGLFVMAVILAIFGLFKLVFYIYRKRNKFERT